MSALFVGEGLLVLGVVLGLAGLFPAYFATQGQASKSLLAQSDQVVLHLCYVIGWAVSAALIALSVARPATARLGALFGLGLGVVTFGLFLADLGEVTQAGVSAGSGLVISLLGWLACTVGSAFALAIKEPQDGQPAADASPRPAGQPAPVSAAGQAEAEARGPAGAARARGHRHRGGVLPVVGQLHPGGLGDGHVADRSPRATRSPATTRALWSPGTSPSWSRSS